MVISPYSVNRTQGLVLGFFALAWLALVAMVTLSSGVREVLTGRMPGDGVATIVGFLVGLLGFLALLAVGVLRRWRWAFWLILVAFAAGVVRVPVAVLQLSGRLAPEGPDWYVVLQSAIGVVQVVIAVLMFAGYRQAGPWGAF
jgi:hypothetical protein